jgi:hypothetical protein
MDARHPLARLIPSPDPDDIESAKHHLHFVVDGALEALVVLDPDVVRWPVPFGVLDHAVELSPVHVRGRRRVRDLVQRLREVLAAHHHQDLVELEDAVRTAMTDASEAGWRIGMMMSRPLVTS